MKALILKELRENLKLAVLGLVVLTILLLKIYRNYGELLKPLAAGGTDAHGAYLQPLANGEILVYLGGFCAVFGALLGWFQSFNERHQDLWSFLAHRPLTRTQLFLGKIIAGLALYLVVAGLPMACFITWAITPGHVAAPFEWPMLLPLVALFLAGPVYYLAGMVTGLRQARWYASRGLALGAALLTSFAAIGPSEFWQALVVIVGLGTILAAATWGGFHSNGCCRGQPQAGKLALTAALALGAFVVSLLAMALLEAFLPRWTPDSGSWSQYAMTKDGTIYKATHPTDQPVQIVDLEGKPLLDPKTGRSLDWPTFERSEVRNYLLGVNFDDRPSRRHYYFRDGYFTFFRATPHTVWFYWPRYGRLVAYDARTRLPAGSLGPEGFAQDFSGAGTRFHYPPGAAPVARTLATTNALYTIDLEARTATLLFAAPEAQPIGAAADLMPHDYDWDYTVVVARRAVYLLKPSGQMVWKALYQPGYPDYDTIQVSLLEPTSRFALWLRPAYQVEQQAPGQHPVHVAWFVGDQLVKTNDLPSLTEPRPGYSARDRIIAGLGAPLMFVAFPLISEENWPERIPWALLWSSLFTAALVCVPIGWWLGGRYCFSLKARLGWAAFHLVAGVPGLLAFLSVQEWPAREPCPKCGKLRVVERENCEHCAAAWPPPEPIGIEIFEPVK